MAYQKKLDRDQKRRRREIVGSRPESRRGYSETRRSLKALRVEIKTRGVLEQGATR